MQGKEVGKLWVFPLLMNMKNMSMKTWKNMNARSQSVITNLGFSCYELENMDLGTRT